MIENDWKTASAASDQRIIPDGGSMAIQFPHGTKLKNESKSRTCRVDLQKVM